MHAFFSEGAGGGVEITDKDAEEDILHIITQCSGYSEIREKKLDELNTLCQGANQINIQKMTKIEWIQILTIFWKSQEVCATPSITED